MFTTIKKYVRLCRTQATYVSDFQYSFRFRGTRSVYAVESMGVVLFSVSRLRYWVSIILEAYKIAKITLAGSIL